jgi:excisionase family DNA binding protein
MDNADLLSIAQVAELLGVNRQRVTQLIRAGRITATRVGRSYVVRRADARFTHLPGGRPRKNSVDKT